MKRIAFLTIVALAACQRNETPKTDSSLAADLALAAQQQTARPVIELKDSAPRAEAEHAPAAKPKPKTTVQRVENAPRVRVTPRQPVVTQPVAPEPQPVQQATAPAPQVTRGPQPGFSAGATFSLASQQRICTASNRPGDRFVATVSHTITGEGGASIPAGSNVVLQVVSVTPPQDGSEGSIAVAVHSVELNGRNYPVTGQVSNEGSLERVRLNAESDKKKVIGGAVAGALIGQIMKKNTKGTVIGAAAGGAAGAVAAKLTEKYDGCLPIGAPMRMTLTNALVI